MTTIPRRRRIPAASRPFLRAACSGVLLGLMSTACVISIHDGNDGWGSDQEECFDQYGECMDDAEEPSDFGACESQLDDCLDGFADDEAGDGDDAPGTSGDGDGDGDGDDDPPHADSDGDDLPPHAETDESEGEGEGDDDPPHADSASDDAPPHAETDEGEGEGEGESDEGEGESEGETSDPEPDCFEMLATCIGEAETLQDLEACALLFDHCIDPGSCDADCGCPPPQ
jgi:hypothetical protein